MEKRTWFITGISSGLGEAIARCVIDCGDFLIGTFRKQEQVQAFNQEYSGRARAFLLDITDEEKVTETIAGIIAEFGKIDVLVNNAGMGFVGAIEESSMAEVRKVLDINFFGPLHLTQVVVPFMRKQKKGHIVQISSHGGIKAFAGFGIYNASKFALEGFSEALSLELAPLGIKVSLVQPGPFRTKFAAAGLGTAARIIDDYAATAGAFRSMLGGADGKQEGDPEQAAKAIMDLVNTENPTLRMPLGKVALTTIGMKLDSVKADLDFHKATAERSVYT